MKKRLLSAALALAMVLTLIPATVVPVAAYDPASSAENGNTASYHAKFDSTITDDTTPGDVPGWFVQVKGTDGKVTGYKKISSGIIVGSTYYDSYANIPGTKPTSFTVIGSQTITMDSSVTSVNIDLYGGVSTTSLSISGPTGLTSVILNDSKYTTEVNAGQRTSTQKASLTAVGTLAADKAVNIQMTNVGGTVAIDRSSAADANGKPVADRITLDNASLGNIKLGKLGTETGTTPKSSAIQNVSLKNGSSASAITVVGNSSRVEITDSTVGSGTGTVDITGTGASFTMSGDSKAGNLTLFGVTKTNNGGKDSTAAPPSVSISAGTVGTITYTPTDEAALGNASVQLTSSSAYSGKITMNKGTVSIASGHANGVELKEGTLNVSGSGATTGDLTLGATKDTTLNVTGTGHTVGTIGGTIANVTLKIPESRTNTYGSTTTNLSTYNKTDADKKIKGGTWVNEVPYKALDSSLAWQLQAGATGKYTYYTQEQLGEALTAQVKGGTGYTITPTNTAGTAPGALTLTFKSGSITWGQISGLNLNDRILLPSAINSTATGRWTETVGADTTPSNSYNSGYDYGMPSASVVLDAGGGAASGNATKLTNAAIAATSAADVDKSVRVSVNNNVITITGSLPVKTTTINLTLTTDVQKADGTYATVNVPVVYYSDTKTLRFQNPGSTPLGYGITVPDLDRLRLSNETVYTLSASVKDINEGVKLDMTASGKTVEVTVSASAYATKALRDGLKAALEGNGAGAATFDWTKSPAIVQAINDVRGGTTDSQIKSWKDSADRTYYLKNHQSVPSTGAPAKYTEVYLVPYLAVTVNEHNSDGGTMKATMTPMYRIEARSTATAAAGEPALDPIVVQTGRTLGTLTGVMADATMTGATVKFASLDYPAGKTFGGTGATLYVHQDGTYVYSYDAAKGITITHAGTNGLGTFEINKTDGLVKLYDATVALGTDKTAIKVTDVTPDNCKGTYDTLQAAVDDAKNGQYIEVDQNYTGSTTINMTGDARTIYVQAVGKTVVVANASGGLVDSNASGSLYTIKLNRDTAPVGGNIKIDTATGGSASVNANPARVGSTVTITLSASAGYSPSGVSVKTSSGQTVSVSGSGSSYTFTMPSGSVTVTPSFTKTNTNATISVNRAITGTGTASTNASGQVSPGTQVTVTTTPGAGQRTMGLSVTGATAIRTGVNTFTFTVPSGYSTVTVTPSFDANNNTIFADVWSSSYYSKAVSWAVNKNPQVTNGSDTYSFSPEDVCNRAQMVTFLWRAAGRPSVAGIANPFVDVSATQTPGDYYSAILWAVSQGITDGTDRTHFSPYATVTRGQAVTFLYRYEKSPAASTNSGFYDVSSREYYARPVSWANAKGVTKGTSTTMFSPNDPVTRAQAVTFLYRDVTGDIA